MAPSFLPRLEQTSTIGLVRSSLLVSFPFGCRLCCCAWSLGRLVNVWLSECVAHCDVPRGALSLFPRQKCDTVRSIPFSYYYYYYCTETWANKTRVIKQNKANRTDKAERQLLLLWARYALECMPSVISTCVVRRVICRQDMLLADASVKSEFIGKKLAIVTPLTTIWHCVCVCVCVCVCSLFSRLLRSELPARVWLWWPLGLRSCHWTMSMSVWNNWRKLCSAYVHSCLWPTARL